MDDDLAFLSDEHGIDEDDIKELAERSGRSVDDVYAVAKQYRDNLNEAAHYAALARLEAALEV